MSGATAPKQDLGKATVCEMTNPDVALAGLLFATCFLSGFPGNPKGRVLLGQHRRKPFTPSVSGFKLMTAFKSF